MNAFKIRKDEKLERNMHTEKWFENMLSEEREKYWWPENMLKLTSLVRVSNNNKASWQSLRSQRRQVLGPDLHEKPVIKSFISNTEEWINTTMLDIWLIW